MIPISKRIRIITRSGYSAQIFRGKENGIAQPLLTLFLHAQVASPFPGERGRVRVRFKELHWQIL